MIELFNGGYNITFGGVTTWLPKFDLSLLSEPYKTNTQNDVDAWLAAGNTIPALVPAPIVLQPNWDELYGRLLDGDLKPILESIQGASTQSLPLNTAFTQMIAVFQPTIRTEQALRDCLDALISFGYSVEPAHKILWNAAISECEFSDLVRIN